jgi:hypothetical protein
MQGILRLAGWGVAATAALLLAVIAANSGTGRERLSDAFAGIDGTRAAEFAKAQADQAAQLARIAAIESDSKRLIEMVRSLAGDRERLMARVSSLERSLEDVTGAIQRQQAATAAPATPPPGATAVEPPAKAAGAAPQTSEPAAAPAPASEPPKRVAGVAASAGMPELEAIQPRAAGVDIGGATNFDGLRALWNTITTSYADLFEGLQPVVTVRENSKSRGADLRLIAGPFTEVEGATRICTMLAAAKRYCRLVQYEGQPLALNVPPAPRRPVAAKQPPSPVRTVP